MFGDFCHMKDSIYKKLMCVQQELNAPKGQYNKFGKYSYRKAEDIIDAVKPILKKYDLGLLLSDETRQEPFRTKTVTITSNVQEKMDKSAHISKEEDVAVIVATATIYDADGNTIAVKAEAGVEKAGGMQLPQSYGSASSYARKYAMSGLFAIDDEKDSDVTQGNPDMKPTASHQPKATIAPQAKAKALPIMTKGHAHWMKAIEHVASGGSMEKDILSKYSMSEADRKKFWVEVEAKKMKGK